MRDPEEVIRDYLFFHTQPNRDFVPCRLTYEALRDLVAQVDWDAVRFTLQALEEGQHIFSSDPDETHMTRFRQTRVPIEQYDIPF